MNITRRREVVFGTIADFFGILINLLALIFALMKLENAEQIIGVLLFSIIEIIQIVALIPNASWKKPLIEGTNKLSIALIAILGASFGFLWTTLGAGYSEPSNHLIQGFSYIGLFILLLGQSLSIWGILTLRKSFSLLPEARELVISGPYRLFHHPIYVGYSMVMFGQVLLFQSIYIFIGFIIALFLFIFRAKFENSKLSVLPEHDIYMKNNLIFRKAYSQLLDLISFQKLLKGCRDRISMVDENPL